MTTSRFPTAVCLLLTGALLAAAAPSATAQEPTAVATEGTVTTRAFETKPDGSPLSRVGQQYYPVDMAEHAESRPGEVGIAKPALPLPEIPNAWDLGFENECLSPANESRTRSLDGWTKNHYRWCRASTIHWQRLKVVNGQLRLEAEILIEAVWLGFADSRNRKFHIWAKTGNTAETVGSFEDDARVAVWADCAGEVGRSSCSSRYSPDVRTRLSDIKAKRNNVFETVITDTSIPNVGLTGDAVAPVQTYSWFTGVGGATNPADAVNTTSNRVRSRCDSAKLRTSNACIFNNVSPYLTYDKNDTAYPVSALIDHIRYAQDTLGAPGRWRNGAPDGPPLTRVRNAKVQKDNRVRPKQQCRTARPSGWNWLVEQCDEYPFASVREGGASGGPVSGRVIPADQNREGGIQLNNWYEWDRILDADTFWVQTLG